MSLLLLFAGARLGSTSSATSTTTAAAIAYGGLSTSAAQGVYLPALSESQIRNTIRTVYALARGGSNSKGTFTLSSTGATLVSVSHVNCTPTSIVTMSPVTASAAAQRATVFTLSSGFTTGAFTVTQATNTATDAIFNYVIHS